MEMDTTAGLALAGSKCTKCDTVAFPASSMCSRCATPTAAPVTLSTTGRVWAYTVQRFAPKSPPYVPLPEGFRPFAVGYVELPDGIKVEAILECESFDELDEAPVRLVSTSPVPRFTVIADSNIGVPQ
ncbi:OB-fold domain-containing protein [Rhodococcus sp. BP-252]|uniref:Zn-ribbon domain-containing OB-fold protein n=2 Tax=Rhodococcus TaxID=1827 RepID=UPI0014311C82|nr:MULTISPECIES: OB-fold domain-containing protein [unclassified Rhodococcus (in: high G+C Gram-positive bacteria)]MBY6412176.1 OB-fold domain-containing protein [Rhodococcus sp. BP-320]MBY6416756.1 OB-fold domain-containing protein [Rhodococcus sp. BP-321]MBY6421055.1 OB-fold domain-containing protein [Rhodococcus sp. BP-324]MBY6426780.1 OB-fold domain-containing protein [Rhodococcus sp. BP-323]MBY6431779.1 OB-fold domain-containing protein [Rhodococcus sp. BP-322]